MRAARTATVLFALLLFAAPLAAQTPVVDGKDLDAAVTRWAAEPESERRRLRSLLGRQDVKRLAHAIDLRRAEAGVSTLSADELAHIAP